MQGAPPAVPERVNHLSFRSSRIIYYGPHACTNCGVTIAKMGQEFGGNAFTYPEGPIYPNTEWHPHVCDPKRASKHRAMQSAVTITAPPGSPSVVLGNFGTGYVFTMPPTEY